MNRKAIKSHISAKGGIEQAMRIPKGTLTPKMKKFAEAAVTNSGAEAYRIAYSRTAKPKTAGDAASRLKSDSRIVAEINRIERANELAALHSSEGLRSIVISTLAEIATNPESKDAVRVQAVRSIGQLVGVDAFRETKRVEHVKDSGELREQILGQLKTLMLASSDVQEVDAESLLSEIASDEPHRPPTTPKKIRDSDSHEHTIPHEQSQDFLDSHEQSPEISEPPPSSLELPTPGGYISGENEDVIK